MFTGSHPALMPPIYLTSHHVESMGRMLAQITAPAGAAWSATNLIVYVPFYLGRAATVHKLFWLNGATVGTNNLQAGVYDADFARVIAGTSTLSAGTINRCQFDDITDTPLGPGRYWMALWCNGTTATVFRTVNATVPAGVYYETNAGGLPATGTPAAPASPTPTVPVFGLALRATP